MGGIQLIVCGDFAQLPPVFKKEDFQKLPAIYKKMTFCFETDTWKKNFNSKNSFLLTENVRQKTDPQFIQMLKEISIGEVTEKTIELLKSRIFNPQQYSKIVEELKIRPVIIYPLHEQVNKENEYQLSRIPGDVFLFASRTIAKNLKKEPRKQIDEERTYIQLLKKKIEHVPESLYLKKGCQVILIQNINKKIGLVNGKQGIVVGFDEKSKYPIVKFTNGVQVTIEPYIWSIRKFSKKHIEKSKLPSWNDPSYQGAFLTQFPLILGYAITIHKSQSATFDYVKLNLSKRIFEKGQAFVALSRCISLNNIYLEDFDPESIKFDTRVSEFYKTQVVKPSIEAIKIINKLFFEDTDMEDSENEKNGKEEEEDSNTNSFTDEKLTISDQLKLNTPSSSSSLTTPSPLTDKSTSSSSDNTLNGKDLVVETKNVLKKWMKYMKRKLVKKVLKI